MPKKILLVDDEDEILMILKDKLEKSGYEVVVACDGLEAINKVRTEKPDLMILDIMMPKVDGYKAAQIIRDSELKDKKPHLPIVMLTSRVEGISETAGFAAGTNVYIKKPFEPSEIVWQIEGLIGK